MTQKLARQQNQFELERVTLHDRADDAFRRLKRTEAESNTQKDKNLELINQISLLEYSQKELNEKILILKSKSAAETDSLVQKHANILEDTQSRLKIVSESHTRAINELQQVLLDQRNLGSKWKDESTYLKRQYEQNTSKYRAESETHQQSLIQIETQLNTSISHNQEKAELISQKKREISVIHGRYLNAEQKVDSLSRQIKVLYT